MLVGLVAPGRGQPYRKASSNLETDRGLSPSLLHLQYTGWILSLFLPLGPCHMLHGLQAW